MDFCARRRLNQPCDTRQTGISKICQDSAIKVIEKALEENPKSGAMLNTLAHLLHLSGDLERAIEVQTRALENPGRNEARIGAFLKQLQREKSGAADAPGEP